MLKKKLKPMDEHGSPLGDQYVKTLGRPTQLHLLCFKLWVSKK